MEYFDFKTIHKFKENLGKLGDIFVNDAPLMTLTNSNSIAEIKCQKKVMGIRMTQEVRKLAMFFLKKYPFDIKNQYTVQPNWQDYYNLRFTAILGGACKNAQEILDKILLANSLIDTASSIHFYGEIALAALHALGIKVGRVERSEKNI